MTSDVTRTETRAETRDLAWYLERLADPSWLCRLADDEPRSVMDSSLNAKHGPRDCNFFLRDEEDGWKVLVDYEGPGCLTRFWTAGDFDGDLEIYFDGSDAPALRTTLRAFFAGQATPFGKPLILDCPDSSKGRVSYLPMPFARGCKVRSRSDTRSFYWQINALRYAEGVDVQTFAATDPGADLDETTAAAWERVRDGWSHRHGFGMGTRAAGLAGPAGQGDARAVEVPARGEALLHEWSGPGCIEELAFRATDPAALTRLALHIHWDGRDEPAVSVPLHHLACQGSKPRDFTSLFARRRDDEIAVAWPMPFAQGATLRLVNPSTAPASVVWRAAVRDDPVDTPLRFHARFRQEVLPYGTIFPLLRLDQRQGRWLGMSHLSRQLGAATAGCFQQEGNEYVYVDGEQDPSWLGTGTEDYFNCAYFYQLGEVDTPTHGCLDQSYSPTGEGAGGLVNAYRWHLLDSVPFHHSLVLLQEAGCPRKGALAGVNGREMLHYEWVCPYYATPGEAVTGGEAMTI